MSTPRIARLQELFKKEISVILHRQMNDPRIGFVSVTDVEVSGDLRHAKIFVSIFGDFLAMFGVISRITFRLHGSASDVALVVAAYMAPVAFIAPIAGVLVDRWRVKRVMIASDLIRGCLAATLVFTHSVPQIALTTAAAAVVRIGSYFICKRLGAQGVVSVGNWS